MSPRNEKDTAAHSSQQFSHGGDEQINCIIMSSVITMSLPSTAVFSDALKGFLNPTIDESSFEKTKLKWKQLCLAALSYGTDYSVHALRSRVRDSTPNTAATRGVNTPNQQPKLQLKFRASKALALFVDVMAKFDAELAASNMRQEQMQRDDEFGKHSYLQRMDPARLILVDSLWIVGQLLLPPDTMPSTGPAKLNQDDESMDKNNICTGNKVEQFPTQISPEEEEALREESMMAYTYIVQGLSGAKFDTKMSFAFSHHKTATLNTPILPPHLLQMLLDPYQLSKADIVPHDQFIRKYRKYQTNILYRQRRFNLLVEESEGWAKVLTLLSSLPLMDNDSGSNFVLEQLRGYIGAFDLDPNRLLSVLLDVLELELDRTLEEIQKERLCAPGRQKDSPVGNKTLIILLDLMKEFKLSALPHLLGFKFRYLSLPEVSDGNMADMAEGGSNEMLMKLSNAEEQVAETISDFVDSGKQIVRNPNPIPLSFFNLCAFLISHNIVSLEELYPYFAPRSDFTETGDETIKVPDQTPSSTLLAPLLLVEWSKLKQKEIAQDVRSWGLISLNASNASGTEARATVDGAKKSSLGADKDCPVLKLLEALLSFGCWKSFTELLELCYYVPPPPLTISTTPSQEQQSPTTERIRTSFEIDVVLLRPTIGKKLCELLHCMLDSWYRNSCLSAPCLWMCKTDVSNMVRNLGMLPGKKPTAIEPYKGYIVKRFSQLTPAEAKIEDDIGTKEEESQLIDNIFDPVMLLASSHEGIPDATLYLKLCHLIQSHLEISSKKEEHSGLSVRGITILQQFLLPSLSLYPTNPQLSQALWSCLQLLPFTKRYSLYDAWANGPRSLQSRIGTPFPLERNAISKTALLGNGCLSSDKPLWAALTEVIAGKETRSVLKRLSKETIREQSRRFAKVSSTAPIVAFSILIQQMQAYDNMIDLMVDSFQLCSDLSRDVLVWCLLQNLAGVDDGKLDTASTQLLTSIETFTGTLYRTFPHLQIEGIFDWLLNGLVASGPVTSNSLSGLGVIRSLITTAGGLEVVGGEGGAVSGQQLEGLAGSQLLRRETVSFGVVDRVNSAASTSLLSILLSSGRKANNIGVALLIRLAQLRLKVLFDHDLKIKDVMKLGKIYDSIQTTMLLLLEFLSSPRDWRESEAEEFLITYASNIPPLDSLLDRKVGYGIDSVAAFAIVRPCIRAALMAEGQILKGHEQKEAKQLECEESRLPAESTTKDHIDIPRPYRRWLPSSPAILDVCRTLIPISFQNTISCTLYCTFWTLDLFDLYVPKLRYAAEINRLNKEEERLLKQRRSAPSETHKFTPKDAAELQRVMKNAKRLKDDELKQTDHSKFVESKIFGPNIEKFFLLPSQNENHMEVSFGTNRTSDKSHAKAFLTICIFPRALSSPDGAFYCAQFVQRLHVMNTPRFSTLQFFDYMVRATIGALMYLTEEEAQNFGILLETLWSVIVDWRYGKDELIDAKTAYEKDVMTKNGSILETTSEPVTYEQFKILYAEWHDSLGKAFVGCLEAKSNGVDNRLTNLRVRAAINILTRIVRTFPTRPEVGDMLFKCLKILQEDEARPETKAIANAYVAQLNKAMLEGCWKEQTATEKREWEEQQQARAEGRKKRAEQTQKEMAAENARIDKITERRDSRGRGDTLRSGREWEKTSDRKKVEEKSVRSPPNLPDVNSFNAPIDARDRGRLERERDREKDREYRERERAGDRQRVEASTDSERRTARGWNLRAWPASSTQPPTSANKVANSGLEGRWRGTPSSAPQAGTSDRESGNKRGRSPSESKSGPPEKKPKSEDSRVRAPLQARPSRYDSASRSESGRRY